MQLISKFPVLYEFDLAEFDMFNIKSQTVYRSCPEAIVS